MDERQRHFAQLASALNQFVAGNVQGPIDRSHRDRSTNDGRSSTGSTSSGSSSGVSSNGNNVAAAVAAVAAGSGSAAGWGELNRALQYGYPSFPSGYNWASQGGVPPDFHRLGNFGGNYNEAGNDGRSPDGRSEGRRVPSKGETKATPPLPPGLAPSRGTTLASLQHLVNLPNEEVYRLIAAQQYAAALSAMPASSRPQVSPGPHTSHSSISPSQMHANISRHHNVDSSNQYSQHYMPQQRYRQSVRNISPLSNASSAPDRQQASPSPDNVSMNGECSEPVRREDRLSPHTNKIKDLLPQPGQIRVSPNLMPTKVPIIREHLSIHSNPPSPYTNDRQCLTNSRISDGQHSGSESEGDQKSRHRRKQHQPRRQTVIYGGNLQPRQDLQQITTNSIDSSSDDSQESDVLMERHMMPQSHNPPSISLNSEHRNSVASMSSAMSHALSHPFLAPHLNQPERKFDNSGMDSVVNTKKKLLPTEIVNGPSLNESSIKVQNIHNPNLNKTSPVMRIPNLIPCNQSAIELDSGKNAPVRTKQTNCVIEDYCTTVKKRKLSQLSPKKTKNVKSGKFSDFKPGIVLSTVTDCIQTKEITKSEDSGSQEIEIKPKEIIDYSKIKLIESSPDKAEECKLVNGDHLLLDELVSPTKSSDQSDDYYDSVKRRTRQKRPISYVEDETDPVQETNEDAMPLVSPSRRRVRRSKEKSESGLSPIEKVTFPSISVRDTSLYEQIDFSSGQKLLQDIPEKVKEPLHIDTNISSESSLACRNQFLSMQSPDIYDFNDTDTECPERHHKKRGRKRGSPRKSDRSPTEFIRSSPRKESFRSARFFPSVQCQELSQDKRKSHETEIQMEFCPNVSDAEHYPNSSPINKRENLPSSRENIIEMDPTLEQYNNNYGKKIYEPYSTISPTKLASLCQEPLDPYETNSFPNNGPYRNEIVKRNYRLSDNCNTLEVNMYNNNQAKKHSKKRKRGRPKGLKSSLEKDSLMATQPLDALMMAGKDSLSNISLNPQSINVSVAQFPSPRSAGRGRRRRRSSNRNFSPSKQPRQNVNSTNGTSPKNKGKTEKGRNIQNSLSSPPDISQATSLSSYRSEDDRDIEMREGKCSVIKSKVECEGETMEDIEKFLKETAPLNETSPLKCDASDSMMTTTPNTSVISTPSTSENSYRECRPKRISRPPPELPEAEMNDLLLLLNMDDEESDDEDYVPRETSDPGSDSRLSLTDLDEDSDLSSATNTPMKSRPLEVSGREIKRKVKLEKKKRSHKKVDSKKKEELKKKTEEKCDRRGPYVRLHNKGCQDIIVNTERDDEEKERNPKKLAVPFHVDKEVKNVKVGFNSTLHPNYNAFTKDMTWYCAFCKMYSHHCGMGDLFGPYFINSSSPSKKNYPTVTEGQVEETISSPEDAASRYSIRRTPHNDIPEFEIRKSEVWESPPMRFVPSATPARMLGRGSIMRTPERGILYSPRLLPGSTGTPSRSKFVGKSDNVSTNAHEKHTENKRPPGTECWIHAGCLLWSSGVTVVNSRLLGLDEAVICAQDSICSHCKESGATVCCLRRGCHLTVHVPCAHFLHWSLDKQLFLSHCPLHVPFKAATK